MFSQIIGVIAALAVGPPLQSLSSARDNSINTPV